ncbi:2,5-didehydrogluconate reductase [Rhodoferax koreense]|uniref:2,5-didehydrogluconate reductase n=1 Tax=Rhodoferax koreensis TaxID=1842727 RepID=A0A1P8K2Y4_9BURK|nr:aldo/keto reductase [Rhodoferax koreense]APW40368.1 2,5-didehydrogluconate reductase [Rhodoferax koreense]
MTLHTKRLGAGPATIPSLGFGTFRMPGADVLDILPQALAIGYRHVDTAQIYGNEAEVGQAIEGSNVPRQEIFLTTKVWVDHYRTGDLQKSVETSLQKLRTDHVDLLLLHWPNPKVPFNETIQALNAVQRAGMARHIGVSNLNTTQMAEAARLSAAPLVTNQVEYHPYLNQDRLLQAAHAANMTVTAYYGLADGTVVNDPLLRAIGERHGKSAVQVTLRWLVQQPSVVALTKTVQPARALSNFDIFDFELSADEMAAVHALTARHQRFVRPDGLAPEWDAA